LQKGRIDDELDLISQAEPVTRNAAVVWAAHVVAMIPR
jgi:hypothetical protein